MTEADLTPGQEIKKSLHFIEEIVENDLASGKHKAIITRFPPEPNGYLQKNTKANAICVSTIPIL